MVNAIIITQNTCSECQDFYVCVTALLHVSVSCSGNDRATKNDNH
jgi:hypothetical protein